MRQGSSRLTGAAAAYEQRDWAQAADLSRQLLKTTKDDPELLRLYARASARLERDATAGAIYGRIGAGWMEPEDSFLVGLGLVRAGKPEAALEIWTEATESRPDHPEMLDHLTRLSGSNATARRGRPGRLGSWRASPAGRHAGCSCSAKSRRCSQTPRAPSTRFGRDWNSTLTRKGLPFGPDHYRKLLARSSLEMGQPDQAIAALHAADGDGWRQFSRTRNRTGY